LPVFAEFIFSAGEVDPPAVGVRIASLLPNPAGEDAGNEVVALRTGPQQPAS
jgi:hypothetical protein